ncbi:MAG: hypothetical protein JJE04_09985 [Acidobacteriia bacterium]|nr:hypothetical protein [Terriglobia bacterium]
MVVNVDVPNEVYEKAAEIARSQHMSVADVIAMACGEHVAAWERLKDRAAKGDREKFLAVLANAPDAEPMDHDRMER